MDYNVNAIIFIEAHIMTTTTRTVEIFPTERSNVLNMVWSRKVDSADVAFTFRAVTEILDKSTEAVHIIVDIRQDPKFPLQTTISETLSGPFRHAKMGQWLVL